MEPRPTSPDIRPQFREREAARTRSRFLPLAVTLIAVAAFGALCLYHYQLPGLYYDEAFDVVPSMQLLHGDPVQLARGVGLHLFGRSFPVMTGDYWGSVSTYAVLPLFWLLGVGVLPVRLWPILAGMLAVFLTYRAGRRMYGRWIGAGAAILLAVFPSFIFWSRVGIYVISHIVAITLGIMLAFLRWRDTGHRRWLLLAAFLTGIGLWTKLLFVWFLIAVPAAYVLLLLADWLSDDGHKWESAAAFVRRAWWRFRADVPLDGLPDIAAALAGFLLGA
ncbi:MAG TPA: glycosyltransferase family 39 protein, partial [Nitrolancea sp.]|nr:glycosyltransferase family 39 protein [Nitrolancea sp.]